MARKKQETDADRLKRLEKAFIEQTALAYAQNTLRGVATMEKLCEVADVHKNYVYCHKPGTPEDHQKYREFQTKVNKFAENFMERKNSIEDTNLSYEQKFQQQAEDNHSLKMGNIALSRAITAVREKRKKDLAEIASLNAIISSGSDPKDNVTSIDEISIHVISPDKGLMHNGRYQFADEKRRKKAWTDARRDFNKLLRRKILQRVYLLMGLPCAGKSYWASQKLVAQDRHAIIIDATNLTAGERALWASQARKANNVKICVVRFFVDFTTIKSRNAKRTDKKIDIEILEAKLEGIQEVDPEFEDVDEMIFVREEF